MIDNWNSFKIKVNNLTNIKKLLFYLNMRCDFSKPEEQPNLFIATINL